jgi:DNA-binding NarL/FixJ family response regulator
VERSSQLASQTRLDQRTRDRRPFQISDFLAPGQPHGLARYGELYRPLVEKSFRRAAGPEDMLNRLSLHRGQQFPQGTWLPVKLLHRFLIQAHRNAVAVARMADELALLRKAVDRLDRGVVILTRNQRIQIATARARQWLVEYFGSPSVTDRLPDVLRSWLRQRTSLPDTHGVRPWEVLVVHREGKRLGVRLLSDAHQTFLLFEERKRVEPTFLERLGITRREAEVLADVAEGKTDTEIGTRLKISPRTVNKHLENIFRKLEVKTRTAAALRALGEC